MNSILHHCYAIFVWSYLSWHASFPEKQRDIY
jgi:hypothetical protein